MPLDHDGLFKVIGKYVKTINTVNGYIAALNTLESEIFVVLEEEDLERYYANPTSIPDEFDSFQSQITAWISQLVINVRDVLQDRDYVIDELNLYQYTVTDILNGLYDFMVDNAVTIESSVVTLGGSDVHLKASDDLVTDGPRPLLFVSRTLDGVNSPGNNVEAHLRYDGLESQLARDAIVIAELIDNTTPGAESAQLFANVPAVEPYQIINESPSGQLTLQNPETNNLIPSNHDFSEWEALNDPAAWSMSGTITTDYADSSGTGNGPIQISTQGITATQKVENLEHNKLFFIGVSFNVPAGGSDLTVTIRLKTLAGVTVSGVSLATTFTSPSDSDFATAFNFFRLPTTVDLSDIYIEIAITTLDVANVVEIRKVVVSPATYWNGLAWVWWPYHHPTNSQSNTPLGHQTSIVIANNDNGVFQTFFRKALNVQLPTADVSTIDDALAV